MEYELVSKTGLALNYNSRNPSGTTERIIESAYKASTMFCIEIFGFQTA